MKRSFRYFLTIFSVIIGIAVLSISNVYAVEENYIYVQPINENTPVYKSENGSLTKMATLSQNEVYSINKSYGKNWFEVNLGGQIGYIHTASVERTQEMPPKLVPNLNIVSSGETTQTTNIYDNSKETLVKIGELEKGQDIDIIKNYGNWYMINFLNREAYIRKSDIKINYVQFSDYFKAESFLEIKVKEGNQLVTKGILNEGYIFKRIDDYGPNWHKIDFRGQDAYVYKKNTIPTTSSIINKSKNNINIKDTISTVGNTIVYDNSNGKLREIAQLHKGVEYPIALDYGNWWGINISGYLGYVRKSVVEHNIKNTDYFKVISSDSQIYTNENGILKQIGTLQKNQVYKKIRDYGSNWCEIDIAGEKAYIRKSNTEPIRGNIKNKSIKVTNLNTTVSLLNNTNVFDNSTGKLKKIATLSKGSEYAVVKDYGKWWGINISGYLAYILKSEVNENIVDSNYFKVLDNNVTVNVKRNNSLKKVGALIAGEVYKKVRNYGPNWYEIQIGNEKGYVYKKGLTLVSENKFKGLEYSGGDILKNVKTIMNTNVFDNSNGELRKIATIDKGLEYPVLSNYGDWYKIQYANQIGFIHKSGVRDLFKKKENVFKLNVDSGLFIQSNNKLVQIGTLKKGQYFERDKDYGNWHQLKMGDKKVYVWKDATNPANYNVSQQLNNNSLRVIKKANVYADVHNKQLALTLDVGTDIPLKKKINKEWYMINLFGRDLYIYAENVDERKAKITKNHAYIEIIKENLFQGPLVSDVASTSVNETIEAANLILRGKINFPDYGIIDISRGVNWKSGGDAIREQHQNSYLRQLHGLFFVNDLVEAFRITNNKVYLEKAYEIIEEWKIKNPMSNPQHRMAWHDEGTARRLIALVNFYDAAKVLDSQRLNVIYDMLTEHALLLMDNNFYSANTNHGMFQDQALLVFSKYFYADGKFDYMYKTALDRLESYFDSLISGDFVHLEHSPSYHQVIASSLKRYGNVLLKFNDKEAANSFLSKYNKMVNYATHVIKPDGTWPLIGDTYGFDNPPNGQLWNDSFYQYAVSKGNLGEQPTQTNVVYPEAGYAIFRDSWLKGNSETYLYFTAAYHTSYHKHSDDLSFWLYHKQDLITEAGPFSYTLTDPTTEYAYSSYGHNVLVVNDLGLPRVDYKFDKTSITSYDLENELHPSVTGTTERYEGVKHDRSLSFNKEVNSIDIKDSITSLKKNNYKLLWHVAPNITPIVDEDNNIVQLLDGEEVLAEIKFNSTSTLDINLYFGNEHEKYKGLHFSEKSDKQEVEISETYVIVLELNDTNAEINTEIQLY